MTMKPLRRVGLEQGTLTLEEYQYVEAEIVEAIHAVLIGRNLFPIENLGDAGWMYSKFYKETDMSQAQISMFGETESDDALIYDDETLPIPIIHKDCCLHWRDILAARHLGEPLDAAHIRNAARQVAEEEDKLLLTGEYLGWPALGIEGLATATGRSTGASAGAWPANAITDVNAARAALQASGFVNQDFVMVGPTAWMKTLDAQLGNTEITYRTFFLQNNLLSAIYESDSVFSAIGGTNSVLVVVPDKSNFDLLVAQEVTDYVWQDKHMNQHIKVYEAVVPRIKRPESIYELTGVS
jgi:uncharacterized linocin/CFP29 family protein